MQRNPATHGVQVPGSTVKSCLTVQQSKRKSQRFMHSGYGFSRVFLPDDLKGDEQSGACRLAESAISVHALLVCRLSDLSYLRNLNAPDHLLANADANGSIDTACGSNYGDAFRKRRAGAQCRRYGPLTSAGASRRPEFMISVWSLCHTTSALSIAMSTGAPFRVCP
jgi:hypothetical protein